MSKILITGGAGFIGSNMADALIKRGDEVVIIDDLSTGKKENFIDGIIHNVIFCKIVIRRFLKYFRKKYRHNRKYWEYFDIEKDFYLIKKK